MDTTYVNEKYYVRTAGARNVSIAFVAICKVLVALFLMNE